MQVIEFLDDSGEIMVARIPQCGAGMFYLGTQRDDLKGLQAALGQGKSGEIVYGSQLIVQESQVAVFFRDGQALDGFRPGRHTLTTENLPALGKLVGTGFGGKSPFRAYVYFVATKMFTNLGWGTPTPVIFRDTDLRMISLRAHGGFAIRITKVRTFLNTIVGTRGLETTFALQEYLRTIIVARLNEVLGKTLKSILDLPLQYSNIALGVKQATADDFGQYGIELVDLLIEAITPPPEVQEMINRATGVAAQDTDKYRAIAAADAIRDAARNPGGAGEGMGLGVGLGMGMAMAKGMAEQFAGKPASSEAAAASAKATPDEVEQKLLRLKGLLEKGLITETDFTEQKRKLLDLL
jgi:membrane protease subunit (stomatin/prohibitin family)